MNPCLEMGTLRGQLGPFVIIILSEIYHALASILVSPHHP